MQPIENPMLQSQSSAGMSQLPAGTPGAMPSMQPQGGFMGLMQRLFANPEFKKRMQAMAGIQQPPAPPQGEYPGAPGYPAPIEPQGGFQGMMGKMSGMGGGQVNAGKTGGLAGASGRIKGRAGY